MEACLEALPDFIASSTSPFKRVCRGPDAFNEDASSPCSAISNLADGLILLKLVLGVLSLCSTASADFSSLTSPFLDISAGTFLISSGSSTLQINNIV